ncbi:unnamed protein product [Effrenium voratum]|uniref:Uncharacterized protein n=1 Tax=Effrenium voratum TaxID=2562239 RepID=A0AA36N9F9_9DINO|nr:unnamed protein product [Effrenium voratum]
MFDTFGRLPVPRAENAEAAGSPQEEAEESIRPKRKVPKPGGISFNMEGAQKALAAARTRVQVQTAVEAAKAKRLNVKDAATQTVRDPEHQDGDIVTIWRLRPRGMESFPHFVKPKKVKKSKEVPVTVQEALETEEPQAPSGDPRAAGARKRPLQEEATGAADLSGGEAMEAMCDPYQTTFEETS